MKYPSKHIFYVLLIIICITSIILADEEKRQYPEVNLRGTEVHDIHSTVLDEDIQLYIAYPPGYKKDSILYPVLYLTDAESFFGYVKTMVSSLNYSKKIPGMIIVGITYKNKKTIWDNRRRDFLPIANEELPGSGGSDKYIKFINNDLFPYVDSTFKSDPKERIFVGMSSGGTLGSYILSTTPEMFYRYLIVSPALHSGNEKIIDFEMKYAAKHDTLNAIVYTSMGEHEPDFMFKSWTTLCDNYDKKDYQEFNLTRDTIEGGTHMDAVYSAYVVGLKAVFSDFNTDVKNKKSGH